MTSFPAADNNTEEETPQTYSVTFRVTNATNQGLGQVTVTLTDTTDNTNVLTGTTTAGDVTISNVKPGEYTVTAAREGYTAPTISNVTVTNSNVTVSDAIVMTSE